MFEAPAGGARAGACVAICFFGAAIVLAGLTAAAACIAKIMAVGSREGAREDAANTISVRCRGNDAIAGRRG
jgi:hypothetical protein